MSIVHTHQSRRDLLDELAGLAIDNLATAGDADWDDERVRSFVPYPCEGDDVPLPKLAPDGALEPLTKGSQGRHVSTLTLAERRLAIFSDTRDPEALHARTRLAVALTVQFRLGARAAARSLFASYEALGKAAKPDRTQQALDDLDLWVEGQIERAVELATGRAYRAGADRAVRSLGISTTGLWDEINPRVTQYARERGAFLVGKRVTPDGEIIENPDPQWSILGATRAMLRQDVQDLFEQPDLTLHDFENRMLDAYAFTAERARMIARTEVAFAESAGSMQAWASSGVVQEVEWIRGEEATRPCEVCDACVAVGRVTLGERFIDGEPYGLFGITNPPAHPNCACALLPVIGGPYADLLQEAIDENAD